MANYCKIGRTCRLATYLIGTRDHHGKKAPNPRYMLRIPAYLMVDDDIEQSIPLPTADEEREMSSSDLPEELPILTLRNTVLYPGVVLPITVGRDASLKLVKDAYNDSKLIGVVAQTNGETENPGESDLYRVGTAASILKLIKMPDGTKSIVIQGKRRFEVTAYTQTDPYLRAAVTAIHEELPGDDAEVQARIRSIKELAVQIINISPNIPSEAAMALQNIDSPTFLIHFIASNLQIEVDYKQQLLEETSILSRADAVMEHLSKELQVLQVSEEIRSKVKSDVDQQQREYLLRQQMKAIQEELGEGEGGGSEIGQLREEAKKKALPEAIMKTFDKELERLSRSNPASPDYAVTRNYVDWILSLPWTESSVDQLDLMKAADVLNADHFGLEKVKDRILEYLAVLKLKGDMKAPILCFYGPPGVGKTSLGKSIARALGREFVRMSLGGMRDEAEIRGHRRTYVGALPGRIIQGMKKAGTINPVFMLDEVDKLGSDFRGDPSSALLEVLDPEQNNAFNDHYLELDYDLSKVLFVATANYLERVPAPLRDRMEVIEINGYTLGEKEQIAKRYLLPRQRKENGLTAKQFAITASAMRDLIEGYTRESGVRQLERTIGSVARGVAKGVAMEEITKASVGKGDLKTYLGPTKFEPEMAERTEVPGVATGLAWTPVGGDILFIETSVAPGKGQFTLTGQLGDVMKESAQAVMSYIRAHANGLGIPEAALKHWDLHVHIPAGAVPKDGPSAGVSLFASIVSALSLRRVRHDVAMTGEITLRGLVLPVGGIKEKVLAARRAGIKSVYLPHKNEKDVSEIAADTLEGVQVHYVKRMEDLLAHVLETKPTQDPSSYFTPTAVPAPPVIAA